MSPSDSEPSPRPRARIAVWLGRVAFVGLGLLGTELGFRGLLWARGTPYSSEAVRLSALEYGRRLAGGVFDDGGRGSASSPAKTIQPFVGWWEGELQAVVDRIYHRGEGLGRADNGRRFEIWMLGGSVARRFARPDSGAAPFLEAIERDPGFRALLGDREPRLRNFAHPGYKQPQQLTLVSFLLALGLAPDAIINLDGFNEVAVGSENVELGSHPVYPSLGQWGTLARNPIGDPDRLGSLIDLYLARRRTDRLTELVLDLGLYRSACVGRIAEELMASARVDWVTMQMRYEREGLDARDDPALRGPAIAPELAEDAVIRAWYEGSAALHWICEGRRVPYLHVLQPTLHDAGSKTWTDAERATSTCTDAWREGVRFGYPRLREEGARLHDEVGVAFFDASRVFADVEATLYHDACHFGELGHRILAPAIAEKFLELFAE
jgi:hypothetical protein